MEDDVPTVVGLVQYVNSFIVILEKNLVKSSKGSIYNQTENVNRCDCSSRDHLRQ